MADASPARRPPRVHGAWTRPWYEGDPALTACFGPVPSTAALDATAEAVGKASVAARGDWTSRLTGVDAGDPVPENALVVLAGQQPVLAGGPLLVAHKAATAVRMAHDLARAWDRPVVPVFLLATEDHDSGEVDHVDFFDNSNGSLRRLRAGIEPRHEAFFRARWHVPEAADAIATLTGGKAPFDAKKAAESFSGHVIELLRETFGPLGLRFVEAHRLNPVGAPILARALGEPAALAAVLERGGRRLEQADLRTSFDPADPRPLVLESRGGRRRRVEADDAGAAGRQAARPEDFSPHAALRPVVQAAGLPVVAQVCGPSELLYLAQARGLHALFGVAPPVLVPRLEATRLPEGRDADARDGPAPGGPLAEALGRLLAAVDGFERTVGEADPGLAGKLRRWRGVVRRSARRLAAAPTWRGRTGGGAADELNPRGRPQDAILSWIVEAWRQGDPAAWGRHIVDLCRPWEPPAHVTHHGPANPVDAVGHPSPRESRHG